MEGRVKQWRIDPRPQNRRIAVMDNALLFHVKQERPTMKATPTLSSDNNKTITTFDRYVMADILRTARELGHVVRIKPGKYQITAPDRSFTLAVATR